MSVVGKLSKYIVIPIYCNWLDVVNVCSLDSAICNHIEREHFLNYIGNEHLAFRGMVLSSNKALNTYLSWIYARNIKSVDLNFRGNCTQKIESQLLDGLKNRLQALSITGNANHSRDGIMRLFKSCTNLEEIHLSATQILKSAEIVNLLTDTCYETLKVIDFTNYHDKNCYLERKSMYYLFTKCTQLTSLTLNNLMGVTEECLIKMLRNCGHNLLELTLEKVTPNDTVLLQSVGMLAKRLQVFVLTSGFSVSYLNSVERWLRPSVLSTLTDNCKDLKTCMLNFPVHDSYKTDYCSFLDTLSTNCLYLTSVSICDVTDDCVETVSMNCKERLRHLTLTKGAMRQSAFILLVQHCPLLTSLDLIGCKTVIDEISMHFCTDMKFLVEQLSTLKYLRTLKMDILSIEEFPYKVLALQLNSIELKLSISFGCYSLNRFWKELEKKVSNFKYQCGKKNSAAAAFTVNCDKIRESTKVCMFYFTLR